MSKMEDIAAARRVDHDQEVEPVMRAISVLKEIHGTGDSLLEDAAVEAAAQGREAYWSLAHYSNQAATGLAAMANRDGLEAALDRYADDFYPTLAKSRLYLLNTIVPLNKRADGVKERLVADLADEFRQMARAKRRAA